MADLAVEVREYTPTDYPACRGLWVDLNQHHRDIYDASSIGGNDPGSGFDEYLAIEKRAISWVATIDDEIVGLVGLLIDGDEAEIEPVVVTAQHRGRGIGRRLVETAIDEARLRNIPSVSVRPVARNTNALEFFRRVGLDTIGHVELFMRLNSTYEGDRPVEAFGQTWTH